MPAKLKNKLEKMPDILGEPVEGLREDYIVLREEEIVLQYLNLPKPRLRARRVDERALAHEAREKAMQTGEWQFLIRHGGAVSHAYRHKALTEAALAVSNTAGEVVVWMAKLPASKVTEGGAAEACLEGTRALYDGRFSSEAREKRREIVRQQHQEYFPQTFFTRLLQDNF